MLHEFTRLEELLLLKSIDLIGLLAHLPCCIVTLHPLLLLHLLEVASKAVLRHGLHDVLSGRVLQGALLHSYVLVQALVVLRLL